LTSAVVPFMVASVNLTSLGGMPNSSIVLYSWFLLTLSHSVLNSINRWLFYIWFSVFSRIWLNDIYIYIYIYILYSSYTSERIGVQCKIASGIYRLQESLWFS
jgi:hypothetical protein